MKKGIDVEKEEHVSKTKTAEEIVLDHLWEDPTYYIKLKKIENKVENSLSVPAELFGDKKGWIISCLHETNSFDEDANGEYYYVTVLSNFAKGYDK